MDYELYEQSGSDIIRRLGKRFSDYRKRMEYSQKTASAKSGLSVWLYSKNSRKNNPDGNERSNGQTVDHLSFIGSRSMGALEYEPAQKLGDNEVFSVDVERLYAFGCRNKYNAIRITLIRKCNPFPHPSIRSHGQ